MCGLVKVSCNRNQGGEEKSGSVRRMQLGKGRGQREEQGAA